MRRSKVIPFPSDPTQSARVAGLRYVRSDSQPGIQRIKKGDGFVYSDPEGNTITGESELARIKSLAIPPAWTDVWICPNPNGHLQAVGRDAKGRKQYRYHSLYRKVRDETKYGRLLAFGEALPEIRKHVEEDLNLPGLPKNKVVATAVKLLDSTGMRVGNDEYTKQNGSHGLTTLRDKHVDISGSKLRFRFRGKSGQQQDIELSDARLARIVRKCRDIPGYELFQYIGEDGSPERLDSSDVNDYLREVTGQDFTAKDFRTWNGTGLAAMALNELGDFEAPSDAKKNIVEAVKQVSQRLGNRPATCKKYYIHPAVIEAYNDKSLFGALQSACGDKPHEDCVKAIVEAYVKNLKPLTEPSDYSRQLKRSLRA